MNGGFKSLVCRDKHYLGFSSKPPLLSPSVVCDLGANFCKIDAAKLTKENLNTKHGKKGEVSKPKTKAKKPKKNEEDQDAGSKAKKSKK